MTPRWTIRRMLLWTFVVALIIPYLLPLFTGRSADLRSFAVGDPEIEAWMRELDQTAIVSHHLRSHSQSEESLQSDYDYLVLTKNAKPDRLVFSHFMKRTKDLIDGGAWEIAGSGMSNGHFSFDFSKDHSHYRIYVWNIPTNELDRELARSHAATAMRIKVLTIGYTSP